MAGPGATSGDQELVGPGATSGARSRQWGPGATSGARSRRQGPGATNRDQEPVGPRATGRANLSREPPILGATLCRPPLFPGRCRAVVLSAQLSPLFLLVFSMLPTVYFFYVKEASSVKSEIL